MQILGTSKGRNGYMLFEIW